MTVKIRKKYELKCNSEKLSPNKTKIINIDKGRIATPYMDNSILVLKPIIDTLSFRYDLQDIPDHNRGELKEQINSYLVQQAKDYESCFQAVSQYAQKDTMFRGYLKNIWLSHKHSTSRTLIQADPKKDKNGNTSRPFLKIRCSPHRIGRKGIDQLRQVIADMTMQEVSLDDILAHKNCIDQLDIAVDILGIAPEDLQIKNAGSADKKHQIITNPTGRKQTQYIDFAAGAGKSARTYIYDKRAEAKDKGEEHEFDEVLHTRIEHSVKTGRSIKTLAKLKNHLKKVNISGMNYRALKCKYDYTHILFIQYALARNLDKAQRLIPDEKKKEFETAYNTARVDIWPDELLWQYWPKAIEKSGLLPSD